MAHTRTWNAAYEAIPADTDNVSEGSDKIRNHKLDIRERVNIDHYMDIAGTDADHGEHRKITLHEPIAKPTNVANKGFIYGKDYNSKIELHYEDEDGNEVRLTTAGEINPKAIRTIEDMDSDTKITVEESPDDDFVRIYSAGVQSVVIGASGGHGCLLIDVITELVTDYGVYIEGVILKDSSISCTEHLNIGSDQIKHYSSSLVQEGFKETSSSEAYETIAQYKFVCPPGPNDLRVHCNLSNQSGSETTSLRVSITGGNNVVFTRSNTAYAWQESTIDISGLTHGTTYELVVEMKTSDSSYQARIRGISVLFEGAYNS